MKPGRKGAYIDIGWIPDERRYVQEARIQSTVFEMVVLGRNSIWNARAWEEEPAYQKISRGMYLPDRKGAY